MIKEKEEQIKGLLEEGKNILYQVYIEHFSIEMTLCLPEEP